MAYLILLIIAIAVLSIIGMWNIYTKAGKPGWACIVPIYNNLVLLEIVGKPWWWLLLWVFVPIANVVIMILVYNELSKSFGKDAGFTVGLILLGFIFIPILGLGDAQYIGPGGIKKI
jgi:hypothetical protein